ncbi:MAG: hypothetical protein A2521_02125 [Deltaproteobacteria bacterium RIFOXYD12_FULL_57_12]|nr:MAG: hypothetical protein A2521_02125 [Deltaproteobacteria bacterium RIFOXYD12_FULL_57_12]
MGGNPEFITGDLKVQEGANFAVSLVQNERAGIIKKLVIPPGRRNQGDPAFHGPACSPDLFRTFPQGVDNTHASDGNPFMGASGHRCLLPAMATSA